MLWKQESHLSSLANRYSSLFLRYIREGILGWVSNRFNLWPQRRTGASDDYHNTFNVIFYFFKRSNVLEIVKLDFFYRKSWNLIEYPT